MSWKEAKMCFFRGSLTTGLRNTALRVTKSITMRMQMLLAASRHSIEPASVVYRTASITLLPEALNVSRDLTQNSEQFTLSEFL